MSILEPDYHDFTGCDCRRENFDGRNLKEANFEGVPLDEATFVGTDLRGANMRFTSLRDAVFESADLRDADLWGADIDGAQFTDCFLRPDTLSRTRLDSNPHLHENHVKSRFDEERERREQPTPPWRTKPPLILAPRRKSISTDAAPEPKKRWPF